MIEVYKCMTDLEKDDCKLFTKEANTSAISRFRFIGERLRGNLRTFFTLRMASFSNGLPARVMEAELLTTFTCLYEYLNCLTKKATGQELQDGIINTDGCTR